MISVVAPQRGRPGSDSLKRPPSTKGCVGFMLQHLDYDMCVSQHSQARKRLYFVEYCGYIL